MQNIDTYLIGVNISHTFEYLYIITVKESELGFMFTPHLLFCICTKVYRENKNPNKMILLDKKPD